MLCYGGFCDATQWDQREARMERRKKREFAVQPDIICFVEGDSWGHSEKRGEERRERLVFVFLRG